MLIFAVDCEALDVRDYAVKRQRLPEDFGARAASRLAQLHALAPADEGIARLAPVDAWRTTTPRTPDARMPDAGAPQGRLVDSCRALQRTLQHTALVHGDVRWENFVVADGVAEPSLIDWEDAGRGSPAWDVGCLFASFTVYAVRAKARFGAGSGAASLDAILRAHTAAAWRSYRDRSARAGDAEFVIEAVRCAGMRIGETAFAPSRTELTGEEERALVDAAQDMLDEPRFAAARWYGIDDPLA